MTFNPKPLKLFAGENRLVSPAQLGELLDLSLHALSSLRQRGEGPPWLRVGPRGVRYELASVEEWLESRQEHKEDK